MSKATKKTNRKKKDKQNEHIKKPTETEIIDVTISYITIPSPNTTDITEEDTVLQTDDTQEESHNDANSDNEAMPLITTEKKIVGCGPFMIKCKHQMVIFLQFVK